jgi:hypothetical protein
MQSCFPSRPSAAAEFHDSEHERQFLNILAARARRSYGRRPFDGAFEPESRKKAAREKSLVSWWYEEIHQLSESDSKGRRFLATRKAPNQQPEIGLGISLEQTGCGQHWMGRLGPDGGSFEHPATPGVHEFQSPP